MKSLVNRLRRLLRRDTGYTLMSAGCWLIAGHAFGRCDWISGGALFGAGLGLWLVPWHIGRVRTREHRDGWLKGHQDVTAALTAEVVGALLGRRRSSMKRTDDTDKTDQKRRAAWLN